MSLKEGGKVVYMGDDFVIEQGSLGHLLAFAGDASHVQWDSGARTGQIDLVPNLDLAVPAGRRTIASEFDQALDREASSTVAVREAYDSYGEDGVLAALDEAGHLATLAPYATEALEALTGHLRHDPGLTVALGSLDEPERETVVLRLAQSLLAEPDEEM